MNTPNGLTRFSRVIITKRSDTCHFCKLPTTAGVDFAAVSADRTWIACCTKCSASLTAQAAGVIASIETMVDGRTIDEDAILMPTDENLLATLQGTASDALAYDTVLALIVARDMVRAQLAKATESPVVTVLRLIAIDPLATPRNRDFAASLVQWFDRTGSLTPKQQAAAEKMVASTVSAKTAAALPVLDNGLYIRTAPDAEGSGTVGTIFKLYTTQNGYQACKRLFVYGDHGSFEFLKGGVKRVREGVADGTVKALTEDEAREFGKLHGFCVNCAKDLDDDRSLAVGYGPVCARHFGWFYPTYEEAAEILGRPCAPKSRG